MPTHARVRSTPLLLALALVLLAGSPTVAQQLGSAAAPSARGPSEIRDEYLLAQPRLTLPAIAPVTTPQGRWTVRVATLWSSSFVWFQDVAGETPKVRDYLVDGESFTLDAAVRRGLTRDLDVALRVPLRWRGGGALDGVIDAWHRLTHLPANHRPAFTRNAFRVAGTTADGRLFSWGDRTGFGLGDLELETRWRAIDGGGRTTSLALVGRLSLPTGSTPFADQGLGGAGQLVLGAPLAPAFDLYAGLGGTAQVGEAVTGMRYEPVRVHAFFALEWRPWRRLSLVGETNAASRLVTGIANYPGLDWLLNVVGRLDVGRRTRLDLGVTENIASQDATTDVALYFAVGLRP